MKTIFFRLKVPLFSLSVLLLAGCAGSYETNYVDAEFGQASRAAMDQQIAQPACMNEDKIPDGLTGLSAEELMTGYTGTFSRPTKTTNVFTFGVKTAGEN